MKENHSLIRKWIPTTHEGIIEASIDPIRIAASAVLDKNKKSELGQFFTPSPIGLFMASLFDSIRGEVKLLDPGCGSGSLTACFVAEAFVRDCITSIQTDTVDIEPAIKPYLLETMKILKTECTNFNVELSHAHFVSDFILTTSANLTTGVFDEGIEQYTHIIMNPPYKKIAANSLHRKALSATGIETVNLYAGFVAFAIKLLNPGGELVAIVPRSFCNGPYYEAFRKFLIGNTSFHHIHIFDSRNKAFGADNVLQENIILHCIKGGTQDLVNITSSPSIDFHRNEMTNSITATDMTYKAVDFCSIVKPNDFRSFIHISSSSRDHEIADQLRHFTSSLEEMGLKVSTGPVVDFRVKKDLRNDYESGSVPLLYPVHLNGKIDWPKKSKKPNAIHVSEASQPWLWKNKGYFVVVRRFSSKEEKRRIVATLYDGSLPEELIGFENKLNVFHINKTGVDENLAKGIYVYLNSSLVDSYYRTFGGHTQVNATDLKALNYPSEDVLRRIGVNVVNNRLEQGEIDKLLIKEIGTMTEEKSKNPLNVQNKIKEALEVLTALEMPKAQQNERSALTLLALLNLHPEGFWQKIENPMMGVTPIMNWCRKIYYRDYAPNTRETFRRQTLHQFVDAGICLYNPDMLDRPVNSPKACYQITNELHSLLIQFSTENWNKMLVSYLSRVKTLVAQYAMDRKMSMIPLGLPGGTEIKLSAGKHSQLIKDIITEFGPRFAPTSEVIYIGDTGAKEGFFDHVRLEELGIVLDKKGKLPDIVLYWPKKNWLLLIESVTSHGPVDGKRHSELSKLFANASPRLVFVTAFPDKKTMTRYLVDISWETEVWIASDPTHMIHFNGDRFLGPHG